MGGFRCSTGGFFCGAIVAEKRSGVCAFWLSILIREAGEIVNAYPKQVHAPGLEHPRRGGQFLNAGLLVSLQSGEKPHTSSIESWDSSESSSVQSSRASVVDFSIFLKHQAMLDSE